MSSRKVFGRMFRSYGLLSAAAIAAALQMQSASADVFTWAGPSTGNLPWQTVDAWKDTLGNPATWRNDPLNLDIAKFDGTSGNTPQIQSGNTWYVGGIIYASGTTGMAIGNTLTWLTTGGAAAFTVTLENNATGTISCGIGSVAVPTTGGLDVSGIGKLYLSGTQSAFSGGVRVSGGATLALGNNNPNSNTAIQTLGDASNSVTLDNGTLVIEGGNAVVGVLANDFVMGAGGGTISLPNGNKSLALTGDITGAGGLSFVGAAASTLTLTGTNTYAGKTTVSSGVLSVSSFADNLGSGALDMGSGTNTVTLLYTGGAGTSINNINLLGVSTNGTNNSNAGGLILDHTGTGVVTFAGNISSASAPANPTPAVPPAIYSPNNRNLTLCGSTDGVGVISGVISDSPTAPLGVVKQGTGTWILNGVNTYTSGTTIIGSNTGGVFTHAGKLVFDTGSIANSRLTVGLGGHAVFDGTASSDVTAMGPKRAFWLEVRSNATFTLTANGAGNTADFFGDIRVGSDYAASGLPSLTIVPDAGCVSVAQFSYLGNPSSLTGSGGTILFRGPNVGTGLNGIDGSTEARFMFDTSLAVSATNNQFAGSTTANVAANAGQKTANVISYAFVQDTAQNTLSIATYDINYGIRALDRATEYSDDNTTVAGQNAMITDNSGTVGGNPKSLTLVSSGTTSAVLSGTSMSIGSNVILSTGSVANIINVDTWNLNNAGTYVYADQDLTINSKINTTYAQAFIKTGPGTLTLTNTDNSFFGNIQIIDGALAFSDVGNLGPEFQSNGTTRRSINLYTGGTLRLEADSGVQVVPQTITVGLGNTPG